jgi:hypothetical protein
LCPTCGESFEASASRRYCAPVIALPAVAVPDVDVLGWVADDVVDPPVFVVAWARTNPSLVRPDVAVAVVVVAPAALSLARSTQPVTVIVLLADGRCDDEDVWEGGVVWATRPAARPTVIAAHAADQVLIFIVPPWFRIPRPALQHLHPCRLGRRDEIRCAVKKENSRARPHVR